MKSLVVVITSVNYPDSFHDSVIIKTIDIATWNETKTTTLTGKNVTINIQTLFDRDRQTLYCFGVYEYLQGVLKLSEDGN